MEPIVQSDPPLCSKKQGISHVKDGAEDFGDAMSLKIRDILASNFKTRCKNLGERDTKVQLASEMF